MNLNNVLWEAVPVYSSGCICCFSYDLGTIPEVALYYSKRFIFFSCCRGNMNWPLKLVTNHDGNPKVRETINLLQLFATEDIFFLGWIVLMWDGDNLTFGKIKLHLPSKLPRFYCEYRSDLRRSLLASLTTVQKASLMIVHCVPSRLCRVKRARGQGLYPGIHQKSPDVVLMFGLHRQLIEFVVKRL